MNKKYILNYWQSSNYGAVLTAYALNNIIKGSHLVDNFSKTMLNRTLDFDFQTKFMNENFTSIEKYNHLINNQLNCLDEENIFFVGSDQVFRPKVAENILNSFLLGEINEKNKKIAFSASFGVDKKQFLKETSPKTIEKMKTAFDLFDYISVREKSGVDIFNSVFNKKAEWIIDPVFVLDKEIYVNLVKNEKELLPKTIVSYLIHEKNRPYKYYKTQKVFELARTNISIEQWLLSIKNCELLITDSFHGMCFAIIFNKPFIAISNGTNSSTRFESLLEMLDIENRCINDIKEISTTDCIFNPNYEKVNKLIDIERKKGLAFLEKVLHSPHKISSQMISTRTKFLEILIEEFKQQANLKYQTKKEVWNLWLIIFHKYLPEPVKNIIRKIRGSK